MAFSWQMSIVIAELGAILLLSRARKVKIIPTTKEGATAAIAQVQEWSKWMAGIQTAAIAGLALMVFEKDTAAVKALPGPAPLFALGGFTSLGAALYCSAWVLSALPSLAIRVHAAAATPGATATVFDIYEQPLFGWTDRVHLGYMLVVTHCLWAGGLLNVALFFGTLLAYGTACG